MTLRAEIKAALRGEHRPKPINWITPRTSTQHESRVGPEVRRMVRDGALIELEIACRPYPGYVLNE